MTQVKAPSSLRHHRSGNQSALLLIDLINTWQYAEGAQLLKQTLKIVPSIQALRERAKKNAIPVIYANDNFGQWRSDFKKVIAKVKTSDSEAAAVLQTLHPDEDDYFLLKPKHSAFYATPLDILLQHLRVSTLVLCGVAGDQCILATAFDAKLRDYKVIIPRDAIASASKERNAAILKHFRDVMGLNTPLSSRLRLRASKTR